MFKQKCNAIFHPITTATRLSSFFLHLKTQLGCYVHRKCKSRILQDIMHKFEFVAPYKKIPILEASAALQ